MIGLVSGFAAGCSSDTMRFAGDPFGNPFGGSSSSPRSEPMTTGSIAPVASAPSGVVEAAPLAAPAAVQPVVTAAVSAPARTASSGKPGWTALGGTPIVVRQGDTLSSLSSRYNVPESAILSANGLSGAGQVAAGRTIVIPVYNAGGSAGTRVASAASSASSGSPRPSAAPATAAAPTAAPPPRPQQLASPAPSAQQVASASPVAPLPTSRPQQGATHASAVQPSASAAVQQAAPARQEPVTTASLPRDDAAGLDFRWPARGRVIAGFGTGGNEGINIALPEGTPVRAAEGGTVAYAGSELKGYGNLVLIRHDNGFVSAYAHNSELLVARGDSVRRGQVIANSGRTGNVNAPQLHFEIRKGSDPVDPMPYLRN